MDYNRFNAMWNLIRDGVQNCTIDHVRKLFLQMTPLAKDLGRVFRMFLA